TPRPPLFPYPTLFRSELGAVGHGHHTRGDTFRAQRLAGAHGEVDLGAGREERDRGRPIAACENIPAATDIVELLHAAHEVRQVRSEEHTSELQSLRHL